MSGRPDGMNGANERMSGSGLRQRHSRQKFDAQSPLNGTDRRFMAGGRPFIREL